MLTDPQFSVITRKPQTLVLIPFGEVPTGIDESKFLISRGGGDTAGGKCPRGREGVVDGNMTEVFEVAWIVLPRCDTYVPDLRSGRSGYV